MLFTTVDCAHVQLVVCDARVCDGVEAAAAAAAAAAAVSGDSHSTACKRQRLRSGVAGLLHPPRSALPRSRVPLCRLKLTPVRTPLTSHTLTVFVKYAAVLQQRQQQQQQQEHALMVNAT